MSFARIYIAAFLLMYGLCNAETTGSRKIKVNDSDIERLITDDAADVLDAESEGEGKKEQRENIEEILPILPPIILLDFDNGTIEDNMTETDEKSKRTVNNRLGYGFDRNSLHTPRKYNYYFPGGKTGTTVSIEESISPFLPRTIIEKVSPDNQEPISKFTDSFTDFRRQGIRGSTGSNYQYYNPTTKSPPVFGMRTKLTKTSDSEPYQGFVPIARPPVDAYSNVDSAYASTTPQSLVFGPAETATATSYATPSPQSYIASSSSRYTYVTPSPLSYAQRYLGQSSQHTVNVQSYLRPRQNAAKSSTSNPHEAATLLEQLNPHNYARPGSNAAESSIPRPDDVSGYSENTGPFPDLPRYTVENGIKYENKIFWKYPDGRVSDEPPMTYETYSEYPSLAALQAKTQDASQIYESTSTENSVMSQGPVQFPMAPESTRPRTPFISINSLSRLQQQQQQQQAFRLGYQNFVGQKQAVLQQTDNGVSPTYSVSSTTLSPLRNSLKLAEKNQKNPYEMLRRPISKYMVNSPNPEYIDNMEKNARLTRLLTQSASGNSAKKINAAGGKNLDRYSNLQYSDLLNYNPSISQYIKNPASILNVQPTFVQAGSSLIPVIILRVDGVPPIQPKAMPNVNLRALLQQYLVQYARSIEELAQQTNYDLGDDQVPKDQNSFSTSPLRELARLAPNSGARDLIGHSTESYIGQSSYETSNLDIEKDLSGRKYGERTAARPKVKSVQIIEDPRLMNHRL